MGMISATTAVFKLVPSWDKRKKEKCLGTLLKNNDAIFGKNNDAVFR
jgi:hypothetical protein